MKLFYANPLSHTHNFDVILNGILYMHAHIYDINIILVETLCSEMSYVEWLLQFGSAQQNILIIVPVYGVYHFPTQVEWECSDGGSGGNNGDDNGLATRSNINQCVCVYAYIKWCINSIYLLFYGNILANFRNNFKNSP